MGQHGYDSGVGVGSEWLNEGNEPKEEPSLEKRIPTSGCNNEAEVLAKKSEPGSGDGEINPKTGHDAKELICDVVGKADTTNLLTEEICKVGDRYIELKEAERVQQEKKRKGRTRDLY